MPAVGSHTASAKLSSTWKSWSNFWAKHSDTWKKPLGVYVKNGGSWVKIWDERPVITNVTTSYFTDTNAFPVNTTYYKNFTVNANGFQTTLTGDTSFSQTTVNANTTADITTETFAFGTFDAANYPTITATNSSGSVTF